MTGTNLTTALTSPDIKNRVAMALGFTGSPEDAKGMAEASKYISSVISVVQNADPKQKLQSCSRESIADAMIDAATMKVAIDGRKHAALIAYNGKATLQITAAGYEAKLHENLERCDVKTDVVFKEDEFKVWSENDYDHFKHVKADPFADNPNEMKGIYVAISYYKNNVRYQRVTLVPLSELKKIKGAAKQAYAWNSWFIERAKTAAIKRAAKRFFNNVQGLQEIVDYDNEKHYDVDVERRSENNLVDNINKGIKGELPAPEEVEVVGVDLAAEGSDETVIVEPEAVKEKPEEKVAAIPEDDVIEQEPEMQNISEAAHSDDVDETGEGIF